VRGHAPFRGCRHFRTYIRDNRSTIDHAAALARAGDARQRNRPLAG